MVDEAPLEETEHGRVAEGDGWFVLNARDAVWIDRVDRGVLCHFEHGQDFPQLGVHIYVLWPKQPMSMYHWEADQEDFLVISGEALLIVDGQERPLRAWDFVHTPAKVAHTFVGAGDGPCVIVAVGARVESTGPNWGAYPVDETALRHNAGVEQETTDPEEAYARFERRGPTRYQDGWLPRAT
ncbi:MAG: cupin domain-containing protein [Gaiellaceae bacterium]